jgi:hypothetical protein
MFGRQKQFLDVPQMIGRPKMFRTSNSGLYVQQEQEEETLTHPQHQAVLNQPQEVPAQSQLLQVGSN